MDGDLPVGQQALDLVQKRKGSVLIMDLKECQNTYYGDTAKVSELIRYLGFSGIALVWLFRVKSNDVLIVPQELHAPSFLLVLGLVLDFCHALTRAITWGIFSWYKEQICKVKETDKFEAPTWINYPAIFFFITKIAAIVSAYVLLLRYLYNNLFG